ncbi:MAG: hypothetical protein ACRCZ9_10655 [Fusobacteriaceae bacterium]
MKNLELQILKFLIEGKAYSDSAIMQNFGIDETELKTVYINLEKDGYLEKYSEYEKRVKGNHEPKGCKGSCGGGCSSGCSNDSWNYENILVLTEKSLNSI